jgi:hypothetical protein
MSAEENIDAGGLNEQNMYTDYYVDEDDLYVDPGLTNFKSQVQHPPVRRRLELLKGSNMSMGNAASVNCSSCLNELCLSEDDYAIYKSWVTVDTYEMVLITLIMIVFLTGVIGNSLVRSIK